MVTRKRTKAYMAANHTLAEGKRDDENGSTFLSIQAPTTTEEKEAPKEHSCIYEFPIGIVSSTNSMAVMYHDHRRTLRCDMWLDLCCVLQASANRGEN